jgi:hypothetical protein
MSGIVFLIEQLSVGLYIAVIAGMVLLAYRWSNDRWAFRATQFELERDLAKYRSGNAMTGIILLFEAALVIAGVQYIVAPTLRRIEGTMAVVDQIQTDIEFSTPTPGARSTVAFDEAGIIFEDVNPADEIVFTATPAPTPVGTIIANPPEIVGCESENATLQIPANGMRVFQITEVVGTAFTENFASYKLEIRGPSTFNNFATLEGSISPVEGLGSLGQFNPAPYEPGMYQFRVVVFDTTDTMRASCTVNIEIDEPQPTRTPLPAAAPVLPTPVP